jgi:hypothetical protein
LGKAAAHIDPGGLAHRTIIHDHARIVEVKFKRIMHFIVVRSIFTWNKQIQAFHVVYSGECTVYQLIVSLLSCNLLARLKDNDQFKTKKVVAVLP